MSISSTRFEGADITFHEAAPALRAYTGCFWVIVAAPGATIRVVPDGTAALGIRFDEGRPGEWSLRGPLLRPEEQRFVRPAALVGVRLRPGVARLLSGIAADQIVGRRVMLTRCPAFRDLVTARLPSCAPDACIDVLQRFLLAGLAKARVHPVVAAALCEIERTHGNVAVGAVADRAGVSARHLNRLMREWVGYGAKRFATIVRFQTTLTRIDDAPTRPPAILATDTGYFDQAHLTTDLSRFGGATPRRLASTAVADFSKTRCDDLP